jgi:hypothetical protein
MNRPVAGHTENETFEESAILPVRGRHAGLQDFAERRCSSAGESITPTFVRSLPQGSYTSSDLSRPGSNTTADRSTDQGCAGGA